MKAAPAPSPEEREHRPSVVRAALWSAILLVIAFYWHRASSADSAFGGPPAEAHYNRLAAGFAQGNLHLATSVPEALGQLRDPYDPDANRPFRGPLFAPGRLHDTSYYQGRIYLYFGVTPAVLLFWPWHALTGHHVAHHHAVAAFCTLGFLASVLLLRAVQRRFFSRAGALALAASIVCLGLANAAPSVLQRPDLWEVPISCGYALMALTLLFIWQATTSPARSRHWLAATGVAFGLAVGARPSLLVTAPLLLVGLWAVVRRHGAGTLSGQTWRAGLALALPVLAIGAALGAYNYARFGSGTEFGQRYQLADDRQDNIGHFAADFVGYNARQYFLTPAQWSFTPTVVAQVPTPPKPAGHGDVERPTGMLVNTPLLWFALILPFFWRRFAAADVAPLRVVLLSSVFSFASSALLLCFFYGACVRYQLEFQPSLALLAAIGICAAAHASAARRRWRSGLFLALAVVGLPSLAFILAADRYLPAEVAYRHGIYLHSLPRPAEAIPYYERALAIVPHSVGVLSHLGNALQETGRLPEAAARFETAVRIAPRDPEARASLGHAQGQLGRHAEAVEQLQAAIALKPDFLGAHVVLSQALRASGRLDEARRQYEVARQLQPALPPPDF